MERILIYIITSNIEKMEKNGKKKKKYYSLLEIIKILKNSKWNKNKNKIRCGGWNNNINIIGGKK